MRTRSIPSKWHLTLFAVIFGMAMAGNSYAGDLAGFQNLKGTIKISGGTAHIPVMEEAAKRIM